MKYDKKILEVLCNFKIPMAIETVRKEACIKSWVTAKATLLDLLAQELIQGIKTSKSWVFWISGNHKEKG